MVINSTKTKCLLITGKRLNNKRENLSLKLTVQGTTVNQVHAQKLLTVTLDESLNFNIHVEQLYVRSCLEE
jgi:hypothetical protein